MWFFWRRVKPLLPEEVAQLKGDLAQEKQIEASKNRILATPKRIKAAADHLADQVDKAREVRNELSKETDHLSALLMATLQSLK